MDLCLTGLLCKVVTSPFLNSSVGMVIGLNMERLAFHSVSVANVASIVIDDVMLRVAEHVCAIFTLL